MSSPPAGSGASAAWPELPEVADWQATRDTVHMWSQVVGKVRLAVTPHMSHWWNVPLYVSSRGLTTSLMQVRGLGFEIEFDFLDHVLVVQTTEGAERRVPLQAQSSVAAFHEATMAALDELGVSVRIRPRPVEVLQATPFTEDTEHRTYDGEAIQLFWRALVQSERVFEIHRSRFVGKTSPVHFFWGAFDLATSRFSGRPAPLHPGGVPNCPDWVMQDAYSHELSSCGFWPGGSEEGSFYAYAYPEPAAFSDWAVPEAASYDAELGEFILPYRSVRTASDPDALILDFLQATYEAAAVAGHWDRVALEAEQPKG